MLFSDSIRTLHRDHERIFILLFATIPKQALRGKRSALARKQRKEMSEGTVHDCLLLVAVKVSFTIV
jgi:hypothetical protein